MKHLLTLLILMPAMLQAQFIQKDTLIRNRWVRMSIPTNYKGDTVPVIIFFPGRGEVGNGLVTDTIKGQLTAGGPHGYIKQGWNGHVALTKDTIRPIVITAQVSDWQTAPSTIPIVDAIAQRFPNGHPFHITGLSMGAWSAGGVLTYKANAADTLRLLKIKTLTAIKGVHFGNTEANLAGIADPSPQRFRNWNKKGGKYLIIESSQDGRGGKALADSLKDGAFFVLSDIGSAGHSAFNAFYGGGGRQPAVLNIGGINQNIYQWMIRQGDTLAGKKPIDVTIIPSADTIVLTVDTVLLSALPDEPGYEWKQVAGPSCTIETPNNSNTVIRGLQSGVYVFEVTGAGQRKAIVLKAVLPKVVGTFRILQMPDGSIRIEPQSPLTLKHL